MVQYEKNSVCCAPYLRNHTPYDCQNDSISRTFLFFQNLIFLGLLEGSKGKKWPRMT